MKNEARLARVKGADGTGKDVCCTCKLYEEMPSDVTCETILHAPMALYSVSLLRGFPMVEGAAEVLLR